VRPSLTPHGFALVLPGAGTLLLETTQAAPALELLDSEYAPGYGRNQPTRVCVASGEFTLPFSIEWKIAPATS